jgi:hypothetical protein
MAHVISIEEVWRCDCGERIRVETFAQFAKGDAVLEKDAVALGWHLWAPDHGDKVNAMCPGCRVDEDKRDFENGFKEET